MGRNGRRLHVGSTEDWEQIELLCGWPEQRDYELIRPMVLFGGPASERAAEATGAASERTAAAQGGALRGRGDGEPFRLLRAHQAQEEAAGFHEAVEGSLEGDLAAIEEGTGTSFTVGSSPTASPCQAGKSGT